MIEITKHPNADTRSANKDFTKETLKEDNESHINDVKAGMNFFADMLIKAGEKHDNTKISNFDDFYNALVSKNVKNSEWYNKHITNERHHLNSHVPKDVNLIDVFEHIVDCVMAGLSRSGVVYDIEIPSDVLQLAHQNTVKLLKDNINVKISEDILDTKIKE